MSDTVIIKVVWCEDRDFCTRETLYVDGKEVMHAGPLCECPEDATLERDLLGPSDFAGLLEKIIKEHNGKKIKFEHEQVDYEDY